MDLNPTSHNNNNSKGVSYYSGFFMLLGLAILGLVVASVIGGAILLSSSDGGLADIEKIMADPSNAGLLRLIQAISVIVSMLIPTIAVAYIMNRKPFRLLGLIKKFPLASVGFVLLIVFSSTFVAGALGGLNKDIAIALGWQGWAEKLENEYLKQVEVMLDMQDLGGYLGSLLLMAFLPAVCEELLFRGGLQNFLTRATRIPWLSILIVSILFSIVHFSVYGFLPRVFLGLMLGYIFHYTGNLWMAIAAHFFNNAFAVTAMYFMVGQEKTISEAMSEDLSFNYYGFIALPILILLFISLRRLSKRAEAEEKGLDFENR